jgi:hypothetical protein
MQFRDQRWTVSFGGRIDIRTESGQMVASFTDTATATYIVDLHNAELDKIENMVTPFDPAILDTLRPERVD